jgi:hypothetical protein
MIWKRSASKISLQRNSGRNFAWLLTVLVTLTPSVAAGIEIELIAKDEVASKFETSLAILKEKIDDQEPPKYILYKAEIEFALTNGLDGKIQGKIPLVGELSGEYGDVSTTRTKFTYQPRPTIPVNFKDSGVVSFLNSIQEKVRLDIENSSFVMTKAEYDEEFIISVDGEGKMSFLSVASVSGHIELKNAHKAKFYFCLMGNDGSCVDF